MGEVLAAATAIAVAAGFVILAADDAKTSTVVVRHARWVTAVALIGLVLSAVLDQNWIALMTASVSSVMVTGIQLVPYVLQARRGGERIGRADVRLSIPFGWTLGYFGLGFAFIGFAMALLAGLCFAVVTRRRRIPFLPFMALGLIVGLLWAAAI